MDERAEVIVVGGGPAGSTTALVLARRGVDVLLLDRAVFPREKLCGDYVNSGAVAALDRLGVLAEIRPLGVGLRGMVIVSPRGRAVRARLPLREGLSIRRDILDDALLRAAGRAGARVRTGRGARSVHREGKHWLVRTDGGVVRGTVLVGADGLRSVVARGAGLRGGLRAGRYGLGVYVNGLAVDPGYAEMHLTAGAYCGVAAFPDGSANVTMVVPRGWLAPWRGRLGEGVARLLRAFPRLRDRMQGLPIADGLRTMGPLAPTGGRVTTDGLVLVGDAAAFTDPLTGQGVSLAVQGGVAAGEAIMGALARGRLDAQALRPYARWHHDHVGRLRGFLRLVQTVAMRPALIEPLLWAWERRPRLAEAFMGVIADGDTPSRLLGPAYVSAVFFSWLPRR